MVIWLDGGVVVWWYVGMVWRFGVRVCLVASHLGSLELKARFPHPQVLFCVPRAELHLVAVVVVALVVVPDSIGHS